MKHLDEYKIFEGKIGDFFIDSRINSICKKYNIRNYTINEDGSIDVDDDVNLIFKNLTKLPLKFNKVNGNFACNFNNLTSLEGCPEYVGGFFRCGKNMLISLEGSPRYIGGYFSCSNNKITSLEGCTEYIGGSFELSGNPIDCITKYFIKKENKNNLIELFNYYDIVQDMNVIYDRLKFFYDGIDVSIARYFINGVRIKANGYKIIY